MKFGFYDNKIEMPFPTWTSTKFVWPPIKYKSIWLCSFHYYDCWALSLSHIYFTLSYELSDRYKIPKRPTNLFIYTLKNKILERPTYKEFYSTWSTIKGDFNENNI